MTVLWIVTVSVLVLGAVGAFWLVDRSAVTRRDETRRAGQTGEVTPDEAARRALGRTAWTRGGGGGA